MAVYPILFLDTMISVNLVDGRDVELSTADCSTFQNVSDKIHSTFGIKCDFTISRTPILNRVMESEKVKDVLKHCTCFTTSLDYWSHKHTLTVVNALNRSHRVSLNMHRVESGHHLLRAIREHVLLGDVMTGFAVCWDGEGGRVVLRSDCSRFEGAINLPLKFYTGEGMVMVASLLYDFMSAKPLEELFDKTPPSDGLCLLKDEVGSFEGYKVFYFDGDGDAHVATAYGCYQINLEQFSRNHNVVIIHDDECYKENLVKDLMEFLGYKVSCEMVSVLSREGLDFGTLPTIAMAPSDFTDKIQPFLESKDIQKLKKIKSNFMELLNSSAEKTDDEEEKEDAKRLCIILTPIDYRRSKGGILGRDVPRGIGVEMTDDESVNALYMKVSKLLTPCLGNSNFKIVVKFNDVYLTDHVLSLSGAGFKTLDKNETQVEVFDMEDPRLDEIYCMKKEDKQDDESSGDDFIYTMEFDTMVAKAYGFEGECVNKNEKKDKVIIMPMYDTTKSIVLYYNAETTKVSQIFDDLYDITELPRGAFDLLLKKTNLPINPDNLLSVFEDDNGEFNFVIRLGGLKGGAGGGVRKHFLKVKGEMDKNITPADATKFQEAFNACTKVLSATSFDLKKSFQEMPLSDLKSLQTYLESGLGTNAVKMGNIGEYLLEQKHIQYAQEKLLVCSKVIKDFVSADITATYGNRIEKVKTTLAVVIGIKEGDEQL